LNLTRSTATRLLVIGGRRLSICDLMTAGTMKNPVTV